MQPGETHRLTRSDGHRAPGASLDRLESWRPGITSALKCGLVVNGFYLPYLSYLGEHMTKAHQMPLLSSPLARNLQFLLRALLYPPHVESHQKSEAASAFYRKAIREAPVNTLFYMHFNQPHTPMPYDEEGAVISRLDFYDYVVRADLGELQRRYFDSMKKVDWRLGETLDLLRAEGKYEDSLIIVTSDHNSLGYSSPYVPLVIKAPGGGGTGHGSGSGHLDSSQTFPRGVSANRATRPRDPSV